MKKIVTLKKRNITISRCIDCPYFENTMDGCECRHPKMAKLAPYGNLICIHTETGFPKECPLL
jgi:histidinol phosphatase-like enzyme